jgi:hypothetical protein
MPEIAAFFDADGGEEIPLEGSAMPGIDPGPPPAPTPAEGLGEGANVGTDLLIALGHDQARVEAVVGDVTVVGIPGRTALVSMRPTPLSVPGVPNNSQSGVNRRNGHQP